MMLWKTNRLCNFRCRYCFCSEAELSREHPRVGRYSARRIARCFDRTERPWWILLTGGEPFLYPNFIGLCRELTRNHFLSINTNNSTSNAVRFADEIDPRRVYVIHASLHLAELERTKKMGRFLDQALYFQKKGFQVCVEYVAYPPFFGRIDRDLRWLKGCGLRFVNLKVYQGVYRSKAYPWAYTPEERDYFRRKALDPREVDFIEKKFAYLGKACRAGRDFLFMNVEGNIRRCPGSAKSYGNFLDGSYSLDRTPRPCPFPRCPSPWIGRDYAGAQRMGIPATLREMMRQGLPFIVSKERMRMTGKSLRNRLRV
ncbi:MAG: radical SAM protein [Candidatus Aminicenantes bacterium]|nr:radical SAM protein [Candidatus Aminicenantes bacterium]